MLKSLYIKNYAIIDELELDFSDGFTVFTGETGAGKSIIVGALSCLIRGKADPSVIRDGTDKAIIEGVFSIEPYMHDTLKEADIDFDNELIVRRVISRDNHNSIKINQCSVTLSFLTDLFGEHIDIHSQKDSQYLLNKKNHLLLLDRFTKDSKLLEEYQDSYRRYRDAVKEYEDLENNSYSKTDLEFYQYDLKELLDAGIDIDEESQLEEKERRYKSAEKYVTLLNQAIDLSEGDGGIGEKTDSLIRSLNADDAEISTIRDRIRDLYYSFGDEIGKLRKILSQYTDEDLNIESIEERLYAYSKLKRKHNTDAPGLLKKIDELKEKIAFFEDREAVLAEKKKKIEELRQISMDLAQQLSSARKQKAFQLEELITENAKELMLPNALFRIVFNDTELNLNGIDDVEFFVSMNKGEEPKPLKNVASGGEISRLMLSLKTVFTSLSETSLVIFDEIDTGVSGKVALSIGKKISEIARSVQVLCITHLAAVAACAKHHFYIYKTDTSSYSNTCVRKLEGKQIIEELAMISSSEISDNSMKAAGELYATAQDLVNDED